MNESEYQIEIDPDAPPFETPDNSESYLVRNGFCHTDEFGVIVDPEMSYIGGELVYTPPSLHASDLDSYAQAELTTCSAVRVRRPTDSLLNFQRPMHVPP